LVNLGFSRSTSEILLVIDFYLKYVLCSFVHGFIVVLSTLVLASWIRVVFVSISVVLRLSATCVYFLLPCFIVVVGGDSPIYPL